MRRTGVAILIACLLGIPAGGAFTFVYAKGFSYLSTDPRAGVNCHIMTPQYHAWQKSGHRHTAICVTCHLPDAGIAKWVAKADHGFRHSLAFTLQNFKALKAKQGVAEYDPNRDATRQEMRAFVCGQCHVEYYFKGDGKIVTYLWANGLKVEEIEAYYDQEAFSDWVHAETGNQVLKAQHPEFEVWSQGIHARSGVACADCHMPYQRVGALKGSDHWVRSPLLNVNRACQTCHAVAERELTARVGDIQDRHHAWLQRAAKATTDMLDAIVAAENSMGFHAPQELARILGETIDFARQGQLEAERAARKK